MGNFELTNSVGDNEIETLNLLTSTQIVIHDALTRLGTKERSI